MSEPFIGQITMFASSFAPRGWAFCDGQLLSIASNTALFSLLGTTYGGDGRTTFALPDLRGRAPIHAGQGPGFPNYRLGAKGGSENVTLTTAQLASHTHSNPVCGTHAKATVYDPADAAFARTEASSQYGPPENMVDTGADLVSSGGGQSHPNEQPYLVIHYIIALQGLFPSRS